MKKLLLISAASALILITGCNQANSANVTEKVSKPVEVTGVRKADLNKGSQNLSHLEYNEADPMNPKTVKPFKKSYFTAPPMIPHSIKKFVPITAKNNNCLNCHLPKMAKIMGIKSMPKSHFIDNFEGGKHIQRVAGSRYFCTTCHAPQAKLDPVIQNKFESLKAAAGLK